MRYVLFGVIMLFTVGGLLGSGGVTAFAEDSIHTAATKGDVTTVTRLLDANQALLNTPDSEFGGLPLHWAAVQGQEAVVKLLLERGTDINARNKDNRTALHLATANGHLAVVALLLAKNAMVNLQDNAGDTPLHFAAATGNKECITRLLTAGAILSFKNKNGLTPRDWALREGKREAVALLVPPSLPDIATRLSTPVQPADTPLVAAVKQSDLAAVMRLLAENPESINMLLTPSGVTVLHYGAVLEQANVTSLLLEKGAKVNAADDGGHTPLHVAAFKGNAVVAAMLLAKGANANAPDNDGNTPLHYAAAAGKSIVVDLLLAKGGDPTIEANNGNTPDANAREKGFPEIAALLAKAAESKAPAKPRLQGIDVNDIVVKETHWMENSYLIRWMPDGQSVLCLKNQGGIYLFDTHGKERCLSPNLRYRAVSPDGKTVYATRKKEGIFAITVKTGAIRQISEKDCVGCSVSPDGKYLLLQSEVNNKCWVVSSDGQQVRQFDGIFWQTLWSPDSNYIVSVLDKKLMIEQADGNGKRVIDNCLLDNPRLSWKDNSTLSICDAWPGDKIILVDFTDPANIVLKPLTDNVDISPSGRWGVTTRNLQKYKDSSICQVALSRLPDGKQYPLAQFVGHQSTIWMTDDRLLVWGFDEHTGRIRTYLVTPGAPPAIALLDWWPQVVGPGGYGREWLLGNNRQGGWREVHVTLSTNGYFLFTDSDGTISLAKVEKQLVRQLFTEDGCITKQIYEQPDGGVIAFMYGNKVGIITLARKGE